MTRSDNGTLPWAALLDPTPEVFFEFRKGHSVWAACGWTWDAVAITPLQRGLAALDELALPMDGEYTVIADHARQELIVYIPCGTGAVLDGLPGVRVLGRGTDLLVPAGQYGTFAAAWLSRPRGEADEAFITPARLRAALLAADAAHHTYETAEPARAE
ncbi:hypothetical protein [Streptomyces katrae]|uniref:hypothetical protein n=1 Tax=Streptomyces katrae TaxID=68223 RepID=UPI000B137A35|nr:hypothetical protein [Streptomyces katrae]